MPGPRPHQSRCVGKGAREGSSSDADCARAAAPVCLWPCFFLRRKAAWQSEESRPLQTPGFEAGRLPLSSSTNFRKGIQPLCLSLSLHEEGRYHEIKSSTP